MWLYWILVGLLSSWQRSLQQSQRLSKMEYCIATTLSKCGEHLSTLQIFTILSSHFFTSLRFASRFQLVKRATLYPLCSLLIVQCLLILLLIPLHVWNVCTVSTLLSMASFLASWYACYISWMVCSTGEMEYFWCIMRHLHCWSSKYNLIRCK